MDLTARIMSRPVSLHWAGWETDTHRLQRAGWSISAEQDVRSMQMAIALRAPNGEAYGVSNRINWEFMEERARFSMAAIPFHAQLAFGRDVHVHHYDAPLSRFAAIDAMPQIMEGKRTRLEDFAHFAPSPLVRNNPIVIPDESVAELMERILKLQQPDRTARIQAALRNPEGYEIASLPKQTFHAQIISFDRAA